MKIHSLNRFLVFGLIALISSHAQAVDERDFIAILQSSAGASAKCAACQQLRIHGTVQCIPTLAGLLDEARVGHAARHALEGLPYGEAGAALRDAVGKTSGLIKAGLVDSLGWREDKAAVPLLVPLLSDQDTTLAATAATALGRIGGQTALTALNTVRDHANPLVRRAVLESLLHCAEDCLTTRDMPGAVALYHDLFNTTVPPMIRCAAWRGLVMSQPDQCARLIVEALKGQDGSLQGAACKLVRELEETQVIRACVQTWDSLDAASQLAVLDAHVQFGTEARATVRRASKSPHVLVRVAAWQALAELGDTTLIPALAHAAAQGEAVEADAARATLTRVHGPGVRDTMLAFLQQANAQEKAEILLALGKRGDDKSASLLLQHATSPEKSGRLAALTSLRDLGASETLLPLLDLAVAAPSAAERMAVLKALFAVCQAYPDKDKAGSQVIEALRGLPASSRRHVLPLLGELATAEALAELKKATQASDVGLVRESIRILTQWPNADPVTCLFELTRASQDSTLRTLALRGAITVCERESDPSRKLAHLQSALKLARRVEEERLVLSQLAQVAQPQALDIVLSYLDESTLENEAGLAALSIAEALSQANPKLADTVARQVLDACQAPALVKRAWALRVKPASGGPFIRDWLVCGPYRQAGASSALTLFDIPFGPEKPDDVVNWYAAPVGDTVPLATFFPAQDFCVAYLKAELTVPQATDAMLLMGSDDGIKVWLNGTEVHSNNIDRGQIVDQDMAPITLKSGPNKLLLKITQGGGGWSACARIVGPDGLFLDGLRVKSQDGAAPPVSAYKPAPVVEKTPLAATLPSRAALRTLCLSEEFFAEGAYYGDFNRDGKTDVVAGPFWFAGPDFQQRHVYRPSKVYDPKGYSDNFLTFTGDFNADGWIDIVCVPMPGTEAYWYANPAGKPGHWARHLACPEVGNESPVWGDITGDGQPELLFCIEGYLGYAGPDLEHPDQPWMFRAISTEDKRYQRFTHGVGYGDINGDGRVDVVEAAGWWEHTAAQSDRPWTFHAKRFADAGAQMLVYDVDGNGLADIITAWHCHQYGMVWWQQIKRSDGQMDWAQHLILSATPDISTADFRPSQLHALKLVDMNGDGLQDVLTGKRFWAHGPSGDKEPSAPAVVFWLELQRDNQGQVSFVPRLIDDNSGVGTQVAAIDLNSDSRPDVIVANKKGIFVHLTGQ